MTGETLSRGDDYRIACRTQIDDYVAYMNGTLQDPPDTDTGGVIAAVDTVDFGSVIDGSGPSTQVLGGVAIFPKGLGDSNLEVVSE